MNTAPAGLQLWAPNLRPIAGRIFLLPLMRHQEVERLFALTAEAFGSPVPQPLAHTAKGRLLEYAQFTRHQSEKALESGVDTQPLEIRLYAAAHSLGLEYRRRLDLRNFREAISTVHLVYKALGIGFRVTLDGDVEISHCAFAKVYTPKICALVSALDRGLVAGITGGATLKFTRRITEGATSCRATITGGPEWK